VIKFLLMALGFSAYLFAQPSDFTNCYGPFLGWKPPGTTPEIFAPGIFSTADYQ